MNIFRKNNNLVHITRSNQPYKQGVDLNHTLYINRVRYKIIDYLLPIAVVAFVILFIVLFIHILIN